MIDTTIRFNDHNSFKVTSVLLGYPFGVEQMDYITHSFQAYSTSMLASATRARTKFFDADGATISDVSHAFAVTTVFGKVEITVAVPATATQAQLMLIQGGTDWWIAEPKSEQGETATPYNVNYQGQLTYITPNGIYTGMMTAGQIVVTGTTARPDETLDTKLVTISNGMINLSATVGNHETRVTTIEAGQITLTSRVDGVEPKVTKITSAGVYTGEIVATQITSGYISANRIASNSITGAKIASTTITGDKIVTGTITATQIAANAITADKINVTNLFVDTLRALDDNGNYVKFSSASDEGTMNFYSAMSGGSPQQRGYIRMFGTSALTFWALPRTGVSPNYKGTTLMNIAHGQAQLSLSDPSQMNSAYLSLDGKVLGIDGTGFYKSTDGGATRTYF